MKNKIAIASAFLAASSFSMGEIVINDFLSFEGFVDMSYSHYDADADDLSLNDSDNSFQIDQVEIDWLFDFDPVTAQIDLQYENAANGDDDETEVEQAFVTYHFDGDFEGVAITAGRYASMLGFEAFEPTGLYQYSTAYASNFLGDLSTLPGYAQGVKVTYETDDSFFGLSVQDEAYDDDADRLGGSGDSSYAVEAAAAYGFGDGFTVFLGGVYEDADVGDSYLVNTYATYETGAWLFAAELNFGNSEYEDALVDEDIDALSGLLMANYAYSDVASVTGRFSYMEFDDDETLEFFKYTLAHNYAFTDNLLLVTEVNYIDGDLDDGGDYEELVGAVELLFSF
ncbi:MULTISPECIES: outer membrane beta-barrel protein [unclassified Lentimonas]|uniref:outer membrane beta-barrel protein n=1 Tax=unclassified Lentimonas TaxID=2630993 RepID=UPI0013259600|nr:MULTISPECIES: outer membrane beta-barrel protein [unclassified Lentimonas]CAA6694072.1 Unannotated [Lentimonas sp. CC19]CAA6694419.1 Unannotated [Lentimonas sp. CC10]CAA7070316.1 Unannotated [Lentimonas sp. CC11]